MIEKMCEVCKKHGVPLPKYKIHLGDIMVKFISLLSVKATVAVLFKTKTVFTVYLL